jgi:hypothetical protein
MRKLLVFTSLALLGCGAKPMHAFEEPPAAPDDAGVEPIDPEPSDASLSPTDALDTAPPAPMCGVPPMPANPMDVVMDAKFSKDYQAYVLGPVPGIPQSRLGGCVIDANDPDALLVATESEAQNGAIYKVKVTREPCGHITGFKGNATLVATTPYVDANLLYGPKGVLFYSMWPVNQLSEIVPMGNAPAYTVDLANVGVGGGGPGGIGFVPPNLNDPGGLRAVTWPSGYWYHLKYGANGNTYSITSSQQTTTIPNGPGGFGYVPKGSPQFAKQSLITPEWGGDKVVVYEVDNAGDPVPATRVEFFNKFPKPWGAYFEPKTGDFIFLTWGASNDQIYIVEGFTKPPPPPPMPPN